MNTYNNYYDYTTGDHAQNPFCLKDEAEYVIHTVKNYLDFCPRTEDVLSAWSGIRPLVRDLSRRETETKQLSRDHVLLGKAHSLPNKHVVTLASLSLSSFRNSWPEGGHHSIGGQVDYL